MNDIILKKGIQRIFLIDDDVTFNFINRNIIKRSGLICEVFDYMEAEKALDMLNVFLLTDEAKLQSLILLDINMPGMDGWEFLEAFDKIKADKNLCSIYILSSSIDPHDIARSKEFSIVTDFLTKPLTIEKIQSLNASYL